MVLRAFGLKHLDMQNLRDLSQNIQSVWSIDIAFVLRACGLDVEYYTITYGANEAFASEHFYADTLRDDIERVNHLFSKAPAAGIAVTKRSISLHQLRQLVRSRQQIVIALVDKLRLGNFSDAPQISPRSVVGLSSSKDSYTTSKMHVMLTRAQCSSTRTTNSSSSNIDNSEEGCAQGRKDKSDNKTCRALEEVTSFVGHYIVIYGWDAGYFLIRDSACCHVRIPEERLEEARKAFGTDEDLLICRMQC
jgi:Guanylylate cyclase